MNTYLFYRKNDFLKWPVDSDACRIYLPMHLFKNQECIEKLSTLSCEKFATLPMIRREKLNIALYADCVDGFLAENIADLKLLEGYTFACDFSFNATNTHTVEYLKLRGAVSVTISPESSVLPEVEGITQEYMIGGPIAVMRSEHCPVSAAVGCESGFSCEECSKRPDHTFWLEEKSGKKFPVLCERNGCRAIILSKEEFRHTGRIPENALKRINIFYGEDYDG